MFNSTERHPAFEEYCECIFELHEDDLEVIQARIAENGILIGYADEDDLRAQRQTFKPRYASHNPLVKEALDRLTGQHVTTEKA